MTKTMRFTVTNKIIVGLGLILLIGMLSMLFIYRGLNIVDTNVDKLAAVEAPTSLAAYEMEINVNGMGLAVLKYLDEGDPLYQAWVSDDEADFQRFHSEYMRLVNTPRERELGERLRPMFGEFNVLGKRLMQKRDVQVASFATVTENIEKIDNIIDEKIVPAIDQQGPDALGKIDASMHMDAWTAEMGLWATNFLQVREPEHREQILAWEREFRKSLRRFEGFDLKPQKAQWAAVVRGILNETSRLVRHILAYEDDLQVGVEQFIDLRLEMDNLLDDEIQPLALDDLTVPRQEAEETTKGVLQTTGYLISIYILAAIAVGWLLIHLINRPLKKLVEGTEAIGRGDLTHRIDARGGDEFADLANHFNHMVDQLQATTVSKALLEASEAKLRTTVDDLRREILEREKLEADLSRSETMSAMGSLVAGVAHEVRNPLFGISSTLDAMHARFRDREGFQRYISVLREEVDRLGGLMRDLLAYSKPAALELAPGAVKDAVGEAIRASAPLAEQAQVKITARIPGDIPEIQMDQMRLAQVFQNLLENAIQHSPPGSTVSIEVENLPECEERWIACSVKDSGPGLAAGDLGRIFEPFFTRRQGGTGLGLAIVRRIVEEHQGQITAANRPEGGAVITVRIRPAPVAIDASIMQA